MSHLTGAQLIDAVEGALDGAGRRHLDACEACRREVGVLGVTLEAARTASVPEPSALFWEHFSARVRDAVGAEGPQGAAPSRPAWLRWPLLVPAAGLAVVIFALVATLTQPAGLDTVVATPPSEGPPSVDAAASDADVDREWRVLADLVGPLDWDTAGAAGLAVIPGDTDLAVLDLTDEERRVLTELLAGEMARLKS